MEKKVINHFFHRHPLILQENYVIESESRDCYGCGNRITHVDAAYVCMVEDCLDWPIFHKKCGELPSQIWHPKHPQHPLHQYKFHNSVLNNWWCNLCCRNLNGKLGYRCFSCNFEIDLACEKINIDAVLEERKQLQHPSHPDHPLTLMRKSVFAFYCDGCGTHDVDLVYTCSICEFWIHKACALLPLTLPPDRRHHHQLSLAFSIPEKHRNYVNYCDVCGKRFNTTCWVYFCGDCRYFAHLSCAANPKIDTTNQDSNLEEDDHDDGSDVIQFPLDGHDIANKLITSFVMREKGLNKIPEVKDMSSFPALIYNYHKHSLSLVLESAEDHNKIINDEDEDEVEKDEVKICNLCGTPISSPPYYECASCEYSIHSICYLLPKILPSSSSSSSSSSFSSPSLDYPIHLHTICPSTHNKTHKFTINSTSMTYMSSHCKLCDLPINGIVYRCEWCKMTIDVKCASLPSSIRHSSHPHHKPLIMTELPRQVVKRWKQCNCCGYGLYLRTAYCCSSDDCDFALHLKCAQLPRSITKREWDKHPLQLTFDASLDHPDDFTCDFCEEELDPKKWMYHCRQCDTSFHLFCFKTASGQYRNIKFGQKVLLDGIHPHPLTSEFVSIVKRCGICRAIVYDRQGLECVSCSFAICLNCGRKAFGF